MAELRNPWDCLSGAPFGAMVAIVASGVRWLVVDYTDEGLLLLARPRAAPNGWLGEHLAVIHPTAVVVLERPR